MKPNRALTALGDQIQATCDASGLPILGFVVFAVVDVDTTGTEYVDVAFTADARAGVDGETMRDAIVEWLAATAATGLGDAS